MAVYRAEHRYAQMSARKIRPIADLVRTLTAVEALEILSCEPGRGARLIEKVIRSAVANAVDRRFPNADKLVVSLITVDGAPMSKRFRPKAKGSSSIYLKRLSHITVVLQ
jgi:large subunit ribosomal protein L22